MMTSARRVFVAATLALSMAIPLATAAQAAPDRSPFYVDDVSVRYLESYPVQVQLVVTGSVPTPCHEPAWTVADDGSFVTVELWSEADPGLACTTVLEEVEVVIPIGEYETAARAVILNDRLAELIRVGQPDEPTLVSAGWSFGMCQGYCRAELVAEAERLKLMIKDNSADMPILLNHGTLTVDGQAQLAAALAAIDPTSLEKTYGCPDCADGGAAWVGLFANGRGSRHDMPVGEPPAELAELYELTQSFISTLETCVSDELVTVDEGCSPGEDG